MNEVKVSEEGEKTLQQPSGIKPGPPTDSVSFRISCKCTGSLSRYFSIQVDHVIHGYKSTCEECCVENGK